MEDVQTLFADVDSFVDGIIGALERDGIDVSNLELDHLCYRVETEDEYRHYQQEFSKLGDLLVESEINGRLISTYKLINPVEVGNRKICVIELPSPKKGSGYHRGFEHVEFVIDESFEDFMNNHPNVEFSTKDISKPVNPDIRIKYDGFSVKFHHNTLEYVIAYEQ